MTKGTTNEADAKLDAEKNAFEAADLNDYPICGCLEVLQQTDTYLLVRATAYAEFTWLFIKNGNASTIWCTLQPGQEHEGVAQSGSVVGIACGHI